MIGSFLVVILVFGSNCAFTAGYANNTLALKNYRVWSILAPIPIPDYVLKAINHLEEEGKIDVFESSANSSTFMIPPHDAEDVLETMEDLNVLVREDVGDVARFIDTIEETNPATRPFLRSASLASNYYMTFNQIESYLRGLRGSAGVDLKKSSIGKSFEGRDIWMVTIKSASIKPKRSIFVEGGIHAREWISPAVTLYLMDSLSRNPDLLKDVEIRIVPVSNPDGYVYSHTSDRMWRKNRKSFRFSNCRGVDLNRNWGHKFGVSGTSTRKCSEVYRGPQAFSEPETIALRDAMKSSPNIKLVLAIHSYSQAMLYPWGYTYSDAPGKQRLKQVAQEFVSEMAKVNGVQYGVISGAELGVASGATDDWAYGVLGARYSYTLELRDKGYYGFLLPANQIADTQREVWAGFKYFLTKIQSENL